MTYAISNDAADFIKSTIGMGSTMAATREGYRIRIPLGPYITHDVIKTKLPEIERFLRDEMKLEPGASIVNEREFILTVAATLERDNHLLFYTGRMARIGAGRDGQMLALLDDTIVPIDHKSPHVMLARDGDRVSLGYRRLTDGSVVVGGFNNLNLPHDWRDR